MTVPIGERMTAVETGVLDKKAALLGGLVAGGVIKALDVLARIVGMP